MRQAFLKCIVTAMLVTGLVVAIGHTSNDSPWLSVWFLLFFFLGIPLVLLSIRDLGLESFRKRGPAFRAWLLLHVCALFAAFIGWLLGYIAVESGHPKAHLHQWLVLILPALVYLTPILLVLHSGNRQFLNTLWQAFRRNPNDNT